MVIGAVACCAVLLIARGLWADQANYQIAASADDTYATSSTNYATSTTMYWPYSNTTRRSFLRWACSIPKGATITSAYVKVRASSSSSNTTTIRLQLLNYDNCPAFSSNPYSYSVTGPTVDWAVPALVAGA
jgi:hypothetical protein